MEVIGTINCNEQIVLLLFNKNKYEENKALTGIEINTNEKTKI